MNILFIITALLAGLFSGIFITLLFLKKQGVSRQSLNDLRGQAEMLNTSNKVLETEKEQLAVQVKQTTVSLEKQNSEVLRLATLLAIQETENRNLAAKLENQKAEMETAFENLTMRFRNLANEILEEKTRKFTEQNRSNLDEILKPLGEKIREFERKVEDTYEKGLKDQTRLQAELLKLFDLNNRISQEAQNLTRALKGDVKKQGNWGEMILSKILEASGLMPDIHYKTQASITSAEGERQQPDVVIYLPDNKHLVVDSKVSLVAYDAWVNAQTEEERTKFAREHVKSIRNHIKLLSEKNYSQLTGLHSPEYVIMFVPVEASFGVAVSEDNEIFGFAWKYKIVIVSPSTLMATLMTVASIWKQENQNRNALEIADKSGQMLDKLADTLKDFLEIGRKLDDARKFHESAVQRLHTGRGNVIARAQQLKDMGAKANKTMPIQPMDELPEPEAPFI